MSAFAWAMVFAGGVCMALLLLAWAWERGHRAHLHSRAACAHDYVREADEATRCLLHRCRHCGQRELVRCDVSEANWPTFRDRWVGEGEGYSVPAAS